MSKKKKKKPTRKNRRPVIPLRGLPGVVQHRDHLAGRCPECASPLTLRRIDNFPVPVEEVQVDYRMKYCAYCGWNNGQLDVRSNRELTPDEMNQIEAALVQRLDLELERYSEFQQKLVSLPFGLATSVMGAAMGYDQAELSLAKQIERGVSPDVAYGELCAALARDPRAAAFFEALAELPEGQAALLESAQHWRGLGFLPPWRELVKSVLGGSDPPGGYEAL